MEQNLLYFLLRDPWTSRWTFPWEESWWHIVRLGSPHEVFGSSSGMVRQSCGHHLSQVEVVPHSAVRTVLGGAFWGGEFMSLLCAIGLSCPTAGRAPSEGVSLLLPVGMVRAIRVFRIHRFKPASERLAWFIFSCL